MTEERRALPAGSTPAEPASQPPRPLPIGEATEVTEALDDAEVEVVPPAQHPPVAPRPSRPASTEVAAGPASAPASAPSRSRESSPSSKRARGRMAIRIPDDEISRPSPAVVETTPAPHVPDEPPSSAPLQPMRIITISSPPPPAPDDVRTQVQPIVPPAPGVPSPVAGEDSWTPFQPTAADGAAAPARADTDMRPPAHSEDLIPIESDPVLDSVDSAEPLELDDDAVAQVVAPAPQPVPRVAVPPQPTNGRPAAVRAASAPPPAAPVAPLPPAAVAAAPSPAAVARSTAPTEPEGEEVQFEDEEAPPTQPRLPLTKDRVSEPGDAAEIAPEDLVSVESAPSPKLDAKPEPRRAQLSPATPALAFAPPAAVKPPTIKQTTPAAATAAATPAKGAQSLAPVRAKAASIPPVTPPPVAVSPVAPVAAKPVLTPPPQAPPPGRAPLVIVPPHVGVAPPSSDPAARRKARPWWEELFNDDFIRTMAKVTDAQIAAEADFIEDSLGVAKGGTVLDLGCGTGRHAIELSRRGYEVVGFDLSLAMLARAADEAQEREQKLNFVQGDMREMTFEDAFDGVYCWNTSFGFFDEESNAKVVERIRKSLKKGGQFVLDVLNRDFVIQQAPSLAWFEGDGCVCMDEMSIDWITSRMKIKRTMMMDDGRSKEIDYSIRVYSLHELGKVLHEQGFRVAEVSGRTATPGVFFGNNSPRTLILAEKR